MPRFFLKLLLLGFIASAAIYLFGASGTKEPVKFNIKQGESASAIAANLKQASAIRSDWLFVLYARFVGVQRNFQPGDYTIPALSTWRELIKILTAPPPSRERVIIFIEGWESFDIADYLDKEKLVSKTDWFTEVGTRETSPRRDWRGEFSFLADLPPERSLEGYLFPDTYRVYRDSTAEDVVRRALMNFEKNLTPEMVNAAKASNRSIFEVVTMASIVEREVRTPIDRRLAADIFWRRLEIGMPLQADSTVNYITRKGLPSITLEDTKIASPYNTYKNAGLPPGPISNPGLDSLKAAAFPQKNDYWYFLTTPDGQVIYSRAFEEHVRNKNKYLR